MRKEAKYRPYTLGAVNTPQHGPSAWSATMATENHAGCCCNRTAVEYTRRTDLPQSIPCTSKGANKGALTDTCWADLEQTPPRKASLPLGRTHDSREEKVMTDARIKFSKIQHQMHGTVLLWNAKRWNNVWLMLHLPHCSEFHQFENFS